MRTALAVPALTAAALLGFAGVASAAAVTGTPGDDNLVGTLGADQINAFGGDDQVAALAGDDTINLGSGSDQLDAGAGNDTIVARPGVDRVAAGAGNDTVDLRDGEPDSLGCGDGADTVTADLGDVVAADCENVTRA